MNNEGFKYSRPDAWDDEPCRYNDYLEHYDGQRECDENLYYESVKDAKWKVHESIKLMRELEFSDEMIRNTINDIMDDQLEIILSN